MAHTFSREYLREFSNKFEAVPMGYSGAWGKLIHEKNLNSNISWHCPFKEKDVASLCKFTEALTFNAVID